MQVKRGGFLIWIKNFKIKNTQTKQKYWAFFSNDPADFVTALYISVCIIMRPTEILANKYI